jgi:hypothetical protein
VRWSRWTIWVGALLLTILSATAWADDEIDIDLWHQELADALGEEPEEARRGPSLGLYPTVGAALGPPNWVSLQANAYVSFTDGKRFSIYGGYGVEWGPQADAHIITLGWGGVGPIPVATKQLGFHGKFLRYRRWDDDDHGIHHGLSFGTEQGVGIGALSFELGAARSERNHWMITIEVALKFALPVYIPLTKTPTKPPSPSS